MALRAISSRCPRAIAEREKPALRASTMPVFSFYCAVASQTTYVEADVFPPWPVQLVWKNSPRGLSILS